MGNYTTDDAGLINIELQAGTYTVYQTSVPNGVVKNEKVFDVVIKAGQNAPVCLTVFTRRKLEMNFSVTPGKYIIKEVSGPDGWTIKTNSQEVTVVATKSAVVKLPRGAPVCLTVFTRRKLEMNFSVRSRTMVLLSFTTT